MKRLGSAALAALFAWAVLPGAASGAVTIEEGFVESHDGTDIHYYLFLPDGASAEDPVPAILRTHGWGGTGESSAPENSTIDKLLDDGYAVVTWDQRGFGRSGGQAEIDHPAYEGGDVSALIDQLLVDNPAIEQTDGDPVIGMTGGSYAGGIQFSAASVDERIDALAPEIAWNDLPQALFTNNVPKLGWDVALYAVGQSGYGGYVEQQSFADGHVGTLNPNIHLSLATTAVDNDPSDFAPFFAERSVAGYVDQIDVPTLVIQGTIDTLFPVEHGVANFLAVEATGAPAKLMLYNAGHTIGSAIPAGSGANNARTRADAAILTWFDRHLKGNTSTDTGPEVEFQVQDGTWRSAGDWSSATTGASFAGETGPLAVTPAPTGGGTIVAGNPNQPEGSARIPIMTPTEDTTLLGMAEVTGTLEGVAPDAFLFFKLVDATTGQVLDDQVTPWRGSVNSVVDGPTPFSVQLSGVSWVVPAGHELVLEVSTGSLMYTTSRVPGVVTASVTGTVPVAS